MTVSTETDHVKIATLKNYVCTVSLLDNVNELESTFLESIWPTL